MKLELDKRRDMEIPMTTPTNVILEFDDLHWLYPENCLEYIDAFVEDFPDIKLSFFVIP